MRTIIETIEKANYVATEAQVETLAHAVVTGARSVGTYLRVLLVACVAQLGTNRRKAAQANQLSVIDAQHEKFYAAVLRGVTNGDEPTPIERNRRATFARSATATLRGFVRAGGDLRTLDVSTVTKNSLRAQGRPAESTDRTTRALQRAEGAVLRSIRRMGKRQPDDAREWLEGFIATLEAELDTLPEVPDVGGTTTTVVGMRGHRTPVAERPGAQLHKAA